MDKQQEGMQIKRVHFLPSQKTLDHNKDQKAVTGKCG